MENTKTFVANDKIQTALGFPVFDTPDWHDRAISKMGICWGNIAHLRSTWIHVSIVAHALINATISLAQATQEHAGCQTGSHA